MSRADGEGQDNGHRHGRQSQRQVSSHQGEAILNGFGQNDKQEQVGNADGTERGQCGSVGSAVAEKLILQPGSSMPVPPKPTVNGFPPWGHLGNQKRTCQQMNKAESGTPRPKRQRPNALVKRHGACNQIQQKQ